MNFNSILIAVLAIVLPALSAAQSEAVGPWSGTAKLGYLATSGNTENSTLNTGFEVGYTSGNWSHLLNAAAITASENKLTTAEAYDLGWKSERRISDHDFLFGRLTWRKDNFGAYDTQFAQTVGYGRRLIENKQNMGFALANNQAIGYSRGRYVLLLNSDTVVHPGALAALTVFMDSHPHVGACGARLLRLRLLHHQRRRRRRRR